MIELRHDTLSFSFPEVHEEARCSISFSRTLRIPDDDREYPLPPGMGEFPLHHVDDYGGRLPKLWSDHGGVFMPMYQAEALWISFAGEYPMAVKVAAGKVDAVTGQPFGNGLNRRPQDYVVIPDQPWLDGFCVRKGLIRQFVAMPLGQGLYGRGAVDRRRGARRPADRRLSDEGVAVRETEGRAARTLRSWCRLLSHAV